MEEDEVIDHLIYLINSKGYSELQDFYGALYSPFKDIPRYTGLYIIERLSRKELKLPEDRQPGDIDLLIIPYSNEEIYFDRTAVFEIKILRPTRKNPKRRPNRFGKEQLLGYVRDGFPFVSALHICMTEPLLPQETTPIKFMLRPANMEKPYPDDIPPLEAFEFVNYDWLPHVAADNHMRRMLAIDIPKYVGLKIKSWNFSETKGLMESRSFEYKDFEGCTWNPHRSLDTVNLIAAHFNENRNKYHNIPILTKETTWAFLDSSKPDLGSIELEEDEENSDEYSNKPTQIDSNDCQSINSVGIPSKYLSKKNLKNLENLLCIKVIGKGLEDGTRKSINDGDYVLIKNLGRPSFENIPMFVPIAILRLIRGEQKIFIGIVTKKHEKSGLLRFSFYNIEYDDNWIYYKSIHQVFYVIKSIPEGDVIKK